MPEAYVEKTQSLLGAIITTPKLTDKLLMKPPFRFLHDIVTSFLGVTGFPLGLYSEELLDSSKTTEKPKKIEFLRLLILAVEAATGVKVTAQPSKIVAGQEADKTNELLQLLSSCAGLTAQQKATAVQKAKGDDGVATAEPSKYAEKEEKEKDSKEEERRRRKEEERRRRKEEEAAAERKSREHDEMANARKKLEEGRDIKQNGEDSHESRKGGEEGRKKRSDRIEEKTERNDDERRRKHEEKRRHERRETVGREEAELTDKGETPPFSRGVLSGTHDVASASFNNTATATAGKAPPRKKPTHQIVDGSQISAAPTAGVIYESKRTKEENAAEAMEGDENDWIKIAEQQEMRLTIDFSGSAADEAGGVAQDAEARGYFGQQALKAKREQEENAARRTEEAEARQLQNDGTGGGGGIIIHTSKSGKSGTTMGEGELSKLRERLQLLTKATNPLGKLLESIYDDIDAMARELEMWRSEARTQALAAADARRQTIDSLQEVHAQLQNVEDAINDQILKTHNIRRNVINNDNAIAGMVRMIVNSDIGKR